MYCFLHRTAVVSQCDVVWSLMRNFSSGQEPVASLPPKVQRMLMFSLLFCDIGERKQQFVTEVGGLTLTTSMGARRFIRSQSNV